MKAWLVTSGEYSDYSVNATCPKVGDLKRKEKPDVQPEA